MRHSILTSFEHPASITPERLNSLISEINDAMGGINTDIRVAVSNSSRAALSAGATPTVVTASNLYAIFSERQTDGVDAGDATAGVWNQRDLNTTDVNTATAYIARSGSLITLQPGTYFISASAPASMVGLHQVKIVEDDGTLLLLGTSEWCGAINTRAFVEGVLTIAAETDLVLAHYTQNEVLTTGLGKAVSAGVGEVYAVLKIFKL